MKILLRVVVGLLVLLVVAAFVGLMFIDSLAEKAVERGGTLALGVPTELDSASIGLTSGQFELERLRVSNPQGYKQPDFFSLRAARLEFPLSALRESRVQIPLLEIEGVALSLERNDKGTNYGVILDHLSRFESGSEKPEAKPEETGGKVFVLDRLAISDVHVSIDLLPFGGEATQASLSIPSVEVKGLGSEMSVADICSLVVKTILNAALERGASQIPKELLDDLRGKLERLPQDIEQQARQQVEGEVEKAAKDLGLPGEAAGRLGDKVNGLLKKKN